MNQETGEDLDPRHKEGRFPKEGGKPKRQSTEAKTAHEHAVRSTCRIYLLLSYCFQKFEKVQWPLG